MHAAGPISIAIRPFLVDRNHLFSWQFRVAGDIEWSCCCCAAAAAGGDVGSDDSYDDSDQNSGHDDSRVPPIHIYPVLRLYGISSASWIAMKWAL